MKLKELKIINKEYAKFVITNRKKERYEVLIDIEDISRIHNLNWWVDSRPPHYVGTTMSKKSIKLHRFLLNITDSNLVVDHIYHNGLDNRKSKIRIALPKDNSKNRNLNKNNSTGFKGVEYRSNAKLKKYRAVIKADNQRISLGCYETAEQAAQVYNHAALKYHGKFANLNRIPDLVNIISTKNQKDIVRSDNKTGYRGVHFISKRQKYKAYIHMNKKRKHLGHFNTAEEAAEAYNKAAIKYFGQFAYLNVIPKKS